MVKSCRTAAAIWFHNDAIDFFGGLFGAIVVSYTGALGRDHLGGTYPGDQERFCRAGRGGGGQVTSPHAVIIHNINPGSFTPSYTVEAQQ